MTSLPLMDAAENRGIDTCTTCPKLCRWACPVAEAEARESSSPWNLVVMSGYLKRGLMSVESVGALPYHCTHCGACTEACLHKNDVPLLLTHARRRLLEGHGAPEGASEVRGHFGVSGNPYGVPLEGALGEVLVGAHHTAPELGRPLAPDAALYMPGCATLKEMPSAAVSFLRAVELQGIGGVQVTQQSGLCCGLPLFWAGDVDGFRSHAQQVAQRLAGARSLVVHDPACAHAMRIRYAEVGVTIDADINHVSTFLAERLQGQTGAATGGEVIAAERLTDDITTPRGPERGTPGGGVGPLDGARGGDAYLDPCSLTRGLRQVETPRRIIARAAGVLPRELPGLVGLEVDCCGAAGLLPVTAPATAAAMAEARIAAFRQTGAQRLLTFSPRCAAHLKRTDPSLNVADVTTLLTKL